MYDIICILLLYPILTWQVSLFQICQYIPPPPGQAAQYFDAGDDNTEVFAGDPALDTLTVTYTGTGTWPKRYNVCKVLSVCCKNNVWYICILQAEATQGQGFDGKYNDSRPHCLIFVFPFLFFFVAHKLHLNLI